MQKIMVALMAFISLFGALFGAYKDTQNNVIFIGHRGYSSRYLENTDEAFIKAAEHGSGGVETDVRKTKDGVLVLSHDGAITLKDGSQMEIADHTYAELTAQPLKNRFTKSELYLCTFRRYLEICQQYDLVSFIEFKGGFSDEFIIEAFNMAREVRGDLSKCSLQSFDMDNLVRAHQLFPDLPIMLTCDEHDELVDKALEYGFDIDMEFSNLDKQTVKQFHDAGLKVAVWTCNLRATVTYALSLGVDYIESDVYAK